MRTRAFTILGVALLVLIGLAAAPAAAAEKAGSAGIPATINWSGAHRPASFPDVIALDTGCSDSHLCIWDQANYGGSKIVFSGSDQGWWTTNFTIRSAKNRFTNRAVGFYNINTGDRVRCLNPTTNKAGPFPDATRVLYIGVLGSRC
jgi:hypothetical protein